MYKQVYNLAAAVVCFGGCLRCAALSVPRMVFLLHGVALFLFRIVSLPIFQWRWLIPLDGFLVKSSFILQDGFPSNVLAYSFGWFPLQELVYLSSGCFPFKQPGLFFWMVSLQVRWLILFQDDPVANTGWAPGGQSLSMLLQTRFGRLDVRGCFLSLCRHSFPKWVLLAEGPACFCCFLVCFGPPAYLFLCFLLLVPSLHRFVSSLPHVVSPSLFLTQLCPTNRFSFQC